MLVKFKKICQFIVLINVEFSIVKVILKRWVDCRVDFGFHLVDECMAAGDG
jgi:hypothetical protein